jgi:hypothetical protein
LVDQKIAAEFQPYLGSGERILWTERPARGISLRPADLFLIPFSMMWLGFAGFWEWSVVRMGADPFMLVFGAAFFLFGFAVMVGRFFADAWIRSRTIYALTGHRALVLRRAWSERLLTERLPAKVTLQRNGRGGGSLVFGGGAWSPFDFASGMCAGFWVPSLADRVQFIGLPDVMEPYRLATGATGSTP